MGTDSPEVRLLPHRGISYQLLASVCLKLERLWKAIPVSGSLREWMRPMLQLHLIHLISLQGPFPHSLTGTLSWKTPQQNCCKQITASESTSFVNPTYISSFAFVFPFQSSSQGSGKWKRADLGSVSHTWFESQSLTNFVTLGASRKHSMVQYVLAKYA